VYEQQQSFLRGLKVDPDTIYNAREQKDTRFEGTCEWILDKTAYKDWKEGSGSKVLIITAPPGQGKSVLAKYLLETFKRSVTESGDFIILDYFGQGTRDNRTTALAIVQSFLYQLLAERRHLFSLVPRQYMRSVDREQELPFEALWKIFTLILKSPQIAEAYCLVDGLDECESDSDRILLRSIENSFTPQGNNRVPSSNRIRFLVTSRSTTPATRLGRLTHWCDIQKSDLDNDIQKVIDFRLQKISKTHELRPTVSGIIRLVLSGSANGMFLWVVLSLDQLEAIQMGLSEFQVAEKLGEIPKNVQEVYAEAIRRIEQTSETRDLAKKILGILIFSVAHLPVRALAAACYDWPESCTTRAELLPHIADKFEDTAKTACGSLIRFVDDTIQFCHNTAIQYLFSPDAALGSFSFDADHIHGDLARICMRYLLLEGISIPEADEQGVINVDENAFPLLEYALYNWFLHLRQSKGVLGQYTELFVRFFNANSERFKECLQAWAYLREFSPENPSDMDSLVLHALIHFRLDNLILRMRLIGPESSNNLGCPLSNTVLELNTHINAASSELNTPLMLAAGISSLSTAEMLLELGADPNLINSNGQTALHIASNGVGAEDLGLVKFLIPKTLSLTTKDKQGYPPFLHVRNKDIAEVFLDNDIDVDSINGIHNKTLLELAAQEGNAELVATLLNRGANVNHRSNDNWTALHAAAGSGNAETIRLLIGKGAEIQAKSQHGWNALHIAVWDGSSESIQLLLDHGIHKNGVGPNGDTALHLAAHRGNEVAVEILLQSGADPNICDNDGDTALHMAASEGRDAIVQKLIEKQAKVNTIGINNSTPLVVACKGNHLSTVKLLLESGADKNYINPERMPMLQMAIHEDYLELAEYLIQANIDLESTFKSNYTPLYVAVWMNRTRIVNILLEKRANTQCYGGDRISALHQCAYHGQRELLKHFLEGADVNTKDDQHLTPLHLAVQEGHLPVVNQLLIANAEVNAPDMGGSTPLYFAALNGHLEVVERLLRARADLEACAGQDSWPPLFIAASKGHLIVAKRLIDEGANVRYRSKTGISALHLVAEVSATDIQTRLMQVDITKKLLQAGVDSGATTQDGETLILAASRGGNLEVFGLLHNHGADVNRGNKYSFTAIHAAADNGNLPIVNRLLELGADANTLDIDRFSPLIYATRKEHLAVVNRLLEVGADANKLNSHRWGALMYAARKGHLALVNRLLEVGADANVFDIYQWSPLMYAAQHGKTEVVGRLLLEELDPNHVNNIFITPLHLATYFCWTPTVEILLDAGANPWALDSVGKTAVEWAHLHEPTFQVMRKRDHSFKATSEGIRTTRLRLSARLSVERIISSRQEEKILFNDLGYILIKLDEADEASAAFEQCIPERDHVWHDIIWIYAR
jgi:ankyrin repeat protein